MDFVQLIPLQVILPLMILLLFPVIKNSRFSCVMMILSFTLSFCIGVFILYSINNNMVGISYYVGGWEPPFGIELKISFLTEMMVCLISFIGLVSSIYTLYALPNEVKEKKHYLINACIMLTYVGMVGMLITNDIFNVYVFLEIASLSTYTLISATGEKEGLVAAFEYLIIGTIGATFYLIGIGFLYSVSGTLNMSDLAAKLPTLIDNKVFKIGILFIILGLILKSALFPLSNWMIKAYSFAPTFVSSFMSGTATKVSLYLLIKYIYLVFGAKFILEKMFFQEFLTILGLMAVVYGSYFAIKQISFRMLLAYSSVAQIGYIILGLALNSAEGLAFSITQIVVHSITKVPLFMIAGLCYIANKTDDIQKISSLNTGKIKLYYVVFAASLFGIPMTSGFITKWYLLSATILKVKFVLFQFSFATIVMASIFSLFYLQNVWKKMNDVNTEKIKEIDIPFYIVVLLFVMAIINIGIGIYPQMLMGLVEQNVFTFFSSEKVATVF